MTAQLAYLLLLPDGPDAELPAGPFRCDRVEHDELHWDGIIDDDGLRFLRPEDLEPFAASLVDFCPRWVRLWARGPREEVFSALPAALEAAFAGCAGGWAFDLLTGRLLARPRALSLPGAFQPLAHLALVTTGGWAMTRGLSKLALPELATAVPPGTLQEAKQWLLELAALHAEDPLTAGAGRPFAAGELQVEVPPGVATAQLDSIPAQLSEGCQRAVAAQLAETGIASHGVLRVRLVAAGDDVTVTHLREDQGGISSPLHRAEPPLLPETAADCLIQALGEPTQGARVAAEGAIVPGSVYNLLQWSERITMGDGNSYDLFVSSGFSDVRPPGFEALVEVGILTRPGASVGVGELLFFLLQLAHLPDMQDQGQFLYPTHTLVCEEPLEAVGLEGFSALMFTFPYFLPPDESVLELYWAGQGPQRVFPILAVPITQAEWEFKAEHGYEALILELAERFPDGEWIVAGARQSAV